MKAGLVLRERGASLLIPVLLVIIVAAFAVVVAANFAATDVQGSSAQADSVETLFLADTGMERALKRFSTNAAGSGTAACTGLGETITDLSAIGLAARTITITPIVNGSGQPTGFSGAVLVSTQCRVQVTGKVNASNVTRTIQALLDKNLLGGSGNSDFNNPATGQPDAWTAGAYDITGGPDPSGANAPSCTRSAYAVKTRTGGSTASNTANLSVNFNATSGSTINVTFDYRIIGIGNSGSTTCTTSSGGATCSGPGSVVDPSSPSGNAGVGEICFFVTDSTSLASNSTYYTVDPSASTTYTVTSCPAPAVFNTVSTPQQSPTLAIYTPCSTKYNLSGTTDVTATKGTVSITVGGTGTRNITSLTFNLFLKAGQPKEIWLDNIEIANSTGSGAARVQYWRDCSVTSCPSS